MLHKYSTWKPEKNSRPQLIISSDGGNRYNKVAVFSNEECVKEFDAWILALVRDAEPIRHGRWIKRTKVHPDLLDDSTYNYECSNCGYGDTHGANVEVPYCWHCGAKMDEEEETWKI